MTTSRIVVWSPDYSLLTGQAFVTQHVLTALPGIEWIEAIFPSGGGLRAFGILSATARMWSAIIRGKSNTIYLICSRSVLGLLRDIPALALSFTGTRIVVHTHGSDLTQLFEHRYIGRLARMLYRRTEIITPSKHLVKDLNHLPTRRTHLCENFGQVEESISSAPILNKDVFRVLWNSNIMASKGIREIVAAIAEVRKTGVDIRITILGNILPDEEASHAEMEQWLTSVIMEPFVDVRGPVPFNEALVFLSEADLVALPSRYKSECQPLAIIHAMMAGKQILVSNSRALRATVGPYPALFSDSSVKSIMESLKKAIILTQTGKLDLSMASAAARNRFSIEKFDQKMTEILLFDQIAQPPAHPQFDVMSVQTFKE